MRDRVESGFELRIKCSDTMRNYWFSQKFKLLGYGEFNHLINILTISFFYKIKEIECLILRKVYIYIYIYWVLMLYRTHSS